MQRNDKFKDLSFPYVAKQPSTNKSVEYRAISDVYSEIIRLHDMSENKKYSIGEALYNSTFYFVDHALLIDGSHQDRIKEYIFCKKFSCPPRPSLDQTEPNLIDEFLIIEQEYNQCIAKEKKDA